MCEWLRGSFLCHLHVCKPGPKQVNFCEWRCKKVLVRSGRLLISAYRNLFSIIPKYCSKHTTPPILQQGAQKSDRFWFILILSYNVDCLRDSLSLLVTRKRFGKIERKACSYQRTVRSSSNNYFFFSCATAEEQRKRKCEIFTQDIRQGTHRK